MKKKYFLMNLLFLLSMNLFGQEAFNGIVLDYENKPIVGAIVLIFQSKIKMVTDSYGKFRIDVGHKDTLKISSMGYQPLIIAIGDLQSNTIKLEKYSEELQEVIVSTGYYEISQERSTGSFTHIDNQLLNRNTSTNILDRLEGITNGLTFNRRNSTFPSDESGIQIRGISTIHSNSQPLIVVDDFPYEGDIENINPNDIESITILKDAAAASIWGARAANGVLVLTTKKGRQSHSTNIFYNGSLSVVEKPNLFQNKSFLAPESFIEVEKELFSRGFYNSSENNLSFPALTPAIEVLIKQRDGLLSITDAEFQLSELAKNDVRRQAEKYLYRNGVSQQHYLSLNGGNEISDYYTSIGFNKASADLIGNSNNRFTLKTSHTYRPLTKLELSTSLFFVQDNAVNNGIQLSQIRPANKVIYPYAQFVGNDGSSLSMINNYRLSYIDNETIDGLLDWYYRPLDEINLTDQRSNGADLIINGGLKYTFLRSLNFDLNYQYQKNNGNSSVLRTADSYYVRDMVNRFTGSDGIRVFPEGGIVSQTNSRQNTHTGRGQLNYRSQINNYHDIVALVGFEIKEVNFISNASQVYGYDPDVLTFQTNLDYDALFPTRPRGSARIAEPTTIFNDKTDRFISYYGNASYMYANRYSLSGSLRWDASNLFGVNTNQKGVPLWSIGSSWLLSREPFYNSDWLSLLKLRTTYGFNGNVDKTSTAYVTTYYSNDMFTGLKYATVRNPGNPELRWEKVGIWNVGIDFAVKNNRLQGSIEYYNKSSQDLLGNVPLDPTTGFNRSYKLNYADMNTKGIDVEINSININRNIRWETSTLFSLVKDKVENYDSESFKPSDFYSSWINPYPIKELPLYRVYSFPWNGLDSETGNPLVNINGELSTSYSDFIQKFTLDDFKYHGSAIPTLFGSIRNTVRWNGFSLSANIIWKAGYYFRRNSISYSNLFTNSDGHEDFVKRWRSPGDELFTDVPSMPEKHDSNRDIVYTLSEILVEKADHIKLQDIQLSYISLNPRKIGVRFRSMKFYLYAKNLGFIWRANKYRLDPDAPNLRYPIQKQLSLGVNLNF